jgi:hypothetical protein
MPADEYSGDIARSLRRVARSSIDQLVATRLEALAADHKLRASQAFRMGVANANKIVLSHPQASRMALNFMTPASEYARTKCIESSICSLVWAAAPSGL